MRRRIASYLDVAELSTRLAQHAPITMHAGLPNGDDLVFQRQGATD
jgi:hypothetical protein